MNAKTFTTPTGVYIRRATFGDAFQCCADYFNEFIRCRFLRPYNLLLCCIVVVENFVSLSTKGATKTISAGSNLKRCLSPLFSCLNVRFPACKAARSRCLTQTLAVIANFPQVIVCHDMTSLQLCDSAPHRCQLKGLRRFTPVSLKSFTFRVTTVNP